MFDRLSKPETPRKSAYQIVGEASRTDIAVVFWRAERLKRLPLDAKRLP